MTTTFALFPKGVSLRNYSSRPTIDVPVLAPARPRVCQEAGCGLEVKYNRDAGLWGEWRHADGSPAHSVLAVRPQDRCVYCGADETTTYRMHAWYDANECSRCGGVDGYAIGD